MELDTELQCRTVGELKKILQDVPDEWTLITVHDNGDAWDIDRVNSYWHGSLTFAIEL